ncbi:UNC93-like protein isoform X2 [Babylonia areolata]|uniref:UNC93-like protein isoform X2 n=1 Tax=Babylonia areolata TaxID=304850 RepID=UPI003FCF3612
MEKDPKLESTNAMDMQIMDQPPAYEPADPASANPNARESEMSKLTIFKNVLVVSIGFLFLFTAFQSMANLQTSLNKEDGVGAYSLSAIYAALIVSCIFLPKFVIAQLGCKWTIPVCMIGYATYMAANFHAVIWLMTLTAVILGIGAAPMWSAKCTYLTQLGVWYSRLTKQSEDAVINKFFGFFFMVFQTSQIWGNMISSLVLEKKPSSNETSVCGADFVPQEDTNNTGFKQPEHLVRTLCIIYLVLAVVAVVFVSLLLDPIKLDKESSVEDRKLSPKLLFSTLKHLFTTPAQMLLVPLTVYSGVEQAFIGGDYTQSYVSCTLGVANVGYIFICYGVVDAACSFTFGRLVQYVGHIPFFVLAFLVHGALQIILLLWTPDPDKEYYFYLVAAFWGMGDAVIQTQINALYGALFTENTEAAFANYRLWESTGFVMTYAYQNSLKTAYKLYICLAFLVTGMLGYAIVEITEKRKQSKKAEITSTTSGL